MNFFFFFFFCISPRSGLWYFTPKARSLSVMLILDVVQMRRRRLDACLIRIGAENLATWLHPSQRQKGPLYPSLSIGNHVVGLETNYYFTVFVVFFINDQSVRSQIQKSCRVRAVVLRLSWIFFFSFLDVFNFCIVIIYFLLSAIFSRVFFFRALYIHILFSVIRY